MPELTGDPVFTRDGSFAYAPAMHGVAALRRDAPSGVLVPLGCSGDPQVPPPEYACSGAPPLQRAIAVALSPDERFLYAAGLVFTDAGQQTGAGVVMTFARDGASGALTPLGCLAPRGVAGCSPARALESPRDLAITPDGSAVYVTSSGESDGDAAILGSVATLVPRPDTGVLEQPDGGAGCIADAGDHGCAPAPAGTLGTASRLAIAPSGRFVYVSRYDWTQTGPVVLARSGDGSLSVAAACGGSDPSRCASGRFMLSPDGRSGYALRGDRIQELAVDDETGLVTATGCADPRGSGGCVAARGLSGLVAGVVSPDGGRLYTLGSGGLAIFER